MLTRLRDSTLTDPSVSHVVPTVTINSLVALDSIFVLLRPTIYQSDAPLVPGIEVDNASGPGPHSPPNYVSFYYNDGDHCYYPNGQCPSPHRELGAFATDTGAHEVASTYNFLLLEAGAVGPTGDVTVNAFDPSPGATVINIIGYVDIHKDGDIDSHTNGFIIYTEKPRPGGPEPRRPARRRDPVDEQRRDALRAGRGPRRRQRRGRRRDRAQHHDHRRQQHCTATARPGSPDTVASASPRTSSRCKSMPTVARSAC